MALPRFITSVAGQAARTLGRTYDYATPGSGTSTLTNAGRAISDPNRVYTGGLNPLNLLPGYGGDAFVSVNNTAPSASGSVQGVTDGGAGTYDDSSGGSYGYSSGGVYDPMAAQRTSWLNMLPGAVSNIGQNARDAFGSAGRSLQGSAESLFNTVNQGQRAINSSRENVELNRLNGVKDILNFVRNGLRSGNAKLANMNATESSAAGELGRVFGSLGTDRMRGVGNQAFLQNRGIDTQQEQLDLQRGQGQTDFHRQRDEVVANIGSQVRQQLAELDAQGQGLGVTGRVAVDQEKQRVIDEGMTQLNAVDQWLQGQLGGIHPQDQGTTRANAVALQQGGTGNITPFDFGQFNGIQVNGPAIDQLPIFTRARRIDRTV